MQSTISELESLPLLMTPAEWAKIRRCSENQLAKERVTGTGAQYLRAGRRILYPRSSALQWLQANMRHSTSEEGSVAA